MEEEKKELLKETIGMEHQGYDCMEAYYKARESKLKEEIIDLRDKARDFGLRNDYLDYKVYKLEDALERKKVSLRRHQEGEEVQLQKDDAGELLQHVGEGPGIDECQ